MEKDHVFEIVIIDSDIHTIPKGIGQDWETAWPILQSSYPDKVVYRINEYDVANYAWSEQEITLTNEASKRISQEFFIDLDGCHQNPEDCLFGRAFVVAYQDSPLYGGIFLEDFPFQLSFRYPIIYPKFSNDGSIIFTIRPYTSISKYYVYAENDWYLIKDERIEVLFDKLGKLIR
jgi:hypothetical protein